jgi:hypothetical protein
MLKKIQYGYLLKKYIKWGVWRVAVCLSYIWDARFLKVNNSITEEESVLKIKIHRAIILPVVLYGCETWSLTLREERRLRVFENRVLRKIL